MSPIWQMITFLAEYQWNHPFRTSAIWRGRVQSNFIEICRQTTTKKTSGRGAARGQKSCIICGRPKCMVPYLIAPFYNVKEIFAIFFGRVKIMWTKCALYAGCVKITRWAQFCYFAKVLCSSFWSAFFLLTFFCALQWSWINTGHLQTSVE